MAGAVDIADGGGGWRTCTKLVQRHAAIVGIHVARRTADDLARAVKDRVRSQGHVGADGVVEAIAVIIVPAVGIMGVPVPGTAKLALAANLHVPRRVHRLGLHIAEIIADPRHGEAGDPILRHRRLHGRTPTRLVVLDGYGGVERWEGWPGRSGEK